MIGEKFFETFDGFYQEDMSFSINILWGIKV